MKNLAERVFNCSGYAGRFLNFQTFPDVDGFKEDRFVTDLSLRRSAAYSPFPPIHSAPDWLQDFVRYSVAWFGMRLKKRQK